MKLIKKACQVNVKSKTSETSSIQTKLNRKLYCTMKLIKKACQVNVKSKNL